MAYLSGFIFCPHTREQPVLPLTVTYQIGSKSRVIMNCNCEAQSSLPKHVSEIPYRGDE